MKEEHKNMDLKSIGNRIRFIRMNKNNLSQEEFATKLSLDRSYLSRVESGKQNITAEVLIRVCEMGLEVSMGDFFDFSKISFEEKV